jgi:SAM-dependent methyltransferase
LVQVRLPVMTTHNEVWSEKTAAGYDAGAAGIFAPEVVNPAVDFLADLAGTDDALEFAIGTGRIGIPLAARGVPVTGIELSEPMVAELRKKIGPDELPVLVGDMATATAGEGFALVFLVFNTISNLRTQARQVECFRNAARHLRPGGRFVIELWVPPIRRMPPGQHAVPMDIGDDHAAFDTYDLVTQECVCHNYYRDAEGNLQHGDGRFRYIWPAECDLMAQLAGLEFESRFADWHRSEFTADSTSHVSVWRKPDEGNGG